jgi:thiamine-phosphate pyrophosphorylase
MSRRDPNAPRLVLFSPPGEADPLLAKACEAADVASIILKTNGLSESEILSRAKALLPIAAKTGAALLLEDRADLAAKAQIDGAHLSDFPAQSSSLPVLKPRFIAGAAGLASRHDAMSAGEMGADYVMFGETSGGGRPPLDSIAERVAWWAEIFQIPCVAFAASLAEVAPLVKAGADFIALDQAVWASEAPLETLAQAMTHLQLERAG